MACEREKSTHGINKVDYVDTLDSLTRERYTEKLKLCGRDPYTIPASEWGTDISVLPDISYPDIVNYLMIEVHILCRS